jgi:hypothetical protein
VIYIATPVAVRGVFFSFTWCWAKRFPIFFGYGLAGIYGINPCSAISAIQSHGSYCADRSIGWGLIFHLTQRSVLDYLSVTLLAFLSIKRQSLETIVISPNV